MSSLERPPQPKIFEFSGEDDYDWPSIQDTEIATLPTTLLSWTTVIAYCLFKGPGLERENKFDPNHPLRRSLIQRVLSKFIDPKGQEENS